MFLKRFFKLHTPKVFGPECMDSPLPGVFGASLHLMHACPRSWGATAFRETLYWRVFPPRTSLQSMAVLDKILCVQSQKKMCACVQMYRNGVQCVHTDQLQKNVCTSFSFDQCVHTLQRCGGWHHPVLDKCGASRFQCVNCLYPIAEPARISWSHERF